MNTNDFFVAATGQNVGKTTTCLGLVAGLQKRHRSVGFLKPVGQEHIETDGGHRVDKDVVLFKDHFQLKESCEEMSPVLFPRGFTRDYLDGKVSHEGLMDKILRAYRDISNQNKITVIEGTGHTGVGSIVDLNNAQVAKMLNVGVILVAPGGLGSCFDELALNVQMCRHHNVKVAGVSLNRVLEEKREMVREYMTKALGRWQIPLLGCIPYNDLLSSPSMRDFELLFQTELLSGEENRLRHFKHIRLVASTVEIYKTIIVPRQLIVTPAGREDIILATLTRFWDMKISHPDRDLKIGMILTGKLPPKDSILEQIKKTNIPMLYVPVSSFIAMKLISSHISKIRTEDIVKVHEAIGLVEKHIDFDALLSATSSKND
jgi:BioD-like phosphotransacetylase family protein